MGNCLLPTFLALCLSRAVSQGAAPAGSVDTTFNATFNTFGYVYALAKQADGSILIGGLFQGLNGSLRQNLARIDSAGNLDTNFAPTIDGGVRTVTVQTDGKLVIGGTFTVINGMTANRLARLTPAGQLDPGFQIGSGADDEVYAVQLQPDGKILVAGQFGKVNGAAHPGLVRLMPNGGVDNSFQTNLAAGSQVYALALQSDAKIVIGGWFRSINGLYRRNLARLKTNGALDESFVANTSSYDWVNTLKVQPDGRIIVGGSICEINLLSRNQLARLNPNGTIDGSIAPGARLNGEVESLELDEQGRILVVVASMMPTGALPAA